MKFIYHILFGNEDMFVERKLLKENKWLNVYFSGKFMKYLVITECELIIYTISIHSSFGQGFSFKQV
jgi:hypothetical protein